MLFKLQFTPLRRPWAVWLAVWMAVFGALWGLVEISLGSVFHAIDLPLSGMMLSIIGFFLTVIWFILPFVIFNIKGRVDRTLFLVEEMERRLTAIEQAIRARDAALSAENREPASPLTPVP